MCFMHNFLYINLISEDGVRGHKEDFLGLSIPVPTLGPCWLQSLTPTRSKGIVRTLSSLPRSLEAQLREQDPGWGVCAGRALRTGNGGKEQGEVSRCVFSRPLREAWRVDRTPGSIMKVNCPIVVKGAPAQHQQRDVLPYSLGGMWEAWQFYSLGLCHCGPWRTVLTGHPGPLSL